MKNTTITIHKLKKTVLVLFCVGLAMGLVSCRAQDGTNSAQETQKVIFEKEDSAFYITMVQTDTLNPLLVKETSADYAMKLVYEGLYGLDDQYNLVGKIAENSVFQNRNRDLLIHLREGVQWHKGGSVNAYDVRYTIEYLKAHPESSYYYMVQNIQSTTIENNHTITLHLKQSNGLEEFNLLFPIIKSGAGGHTPFRVNGCGRYALAQSDKIDIIELKLFDQYYGKQGTIEKVRIKIVPSEQIRENLFLSTDSDVMESKKDDLSKYDYEIFKRKAFENLQYEMLVFNTAREPFHSVENRKALISAIDRNMIVKQGYRLEKEYNGIFIAPKSKLHTNHILLPYDTERMKESWKTQKKRTYQLLVDTNNPARFASANLVRRELAKVNIDVEVIGVEQEQLKAKLHAGNYDMAMVGYKVSLIPNIMKLANGKNIFFYNMGGLNEKMSSIQQEGEGNDFIRRYKDFQTQFAGKSFYAGFGFLDSYVILNRRIEGELKSNAFDIYNGIEELSVRGKVVSQESTEEITVSEAEEKKEP